MADTAQQQDDAVERDENFTEGLTLNEAAGSLLDLFAEDPDFAEATDPDEDDDGEQDVEDDFDDEDFDDEDFDDEEFDDEYPEDDDFDEEAEDETDDSEPQTYKVTVDGEEETVTLDEALAGYMRQRAFTKKTTEVADAKSRLREKQQELLGLEQQYVQNLELVENVLRGGLPEDPDWAEVRRQNPDNYAEIRDAWDQRQSQIKAVRQQRQEAIDAAKKRIEDERQAKFEEEQEKLRAALPEWLDPEVHREESAKLVKAAGHYGVTPEELESVLDHRFILILRDAMRARETDETTKETKKVKRRTRRKSKNLRSGTRTSRRRRTSKVSKRSQNARKRLAKSGRISDAETALLDFFND